MSGDLKACLWCWLTILMNFVHEPLPLSRIRRPVIELFTDARSKPPRIAGVMLGSLSPVYTAWDPDEETMAAWVLRIDDQIVALELLAVVVSVLTFCEELSGTSVRLWIDNSVGEFALSKGSAKAADHNKLVHIVWTLAAKFHFGLWVERVPSELNISDEPSREVPFAMDRIGAGFVRPVPCRKLTAYWALDEQLIEALVHL